MVSGCTKYSSVKALDDCSSNLINWNNPVVPNARQVLKIDLAAAKDGNSAPKSGKRCGANFPRRAVKACHDSTSFGATFLRVAIFVSRSITIPSDLPSGKSDINGLLEGTNSNPLRIRSSFSAAIIGPPAKRLKFVANKSCLKPGSVISSVRTAPPQESLDSRTKVRLPRLAKRAAELSPFMPDPITITSKLLICRSSHAHQINSIICHSGLSMKNRLRFQHQVAGRI